ICGIFSDTINVFYSNIELGNDTTICEGMSLLLNAYIPTNGTYQWHDNSVGSSFTVTQQGKYWVEQIDYCGLKADSITVLYSPLPTINLGNDTIICKG